MTLKALIFDVDGTLAKTIDLLFRFSAKACGKEFAALTDQEVTQIEETYSNFNPI